MFSVAYEDPAIWGEHERGAHLYLHRIARATTYPARGLVDAVLAWGRAHCRALGRAGLRMDTWASNATLVAYYERLGFRLVGRRRMRALYLGRRDALLDGLARHCEGLLPVGNADAGLRVTARLPSGTDDAAVVRRLKARGLAPTARSPCYVGPTTTPGLLLGFGGSREPALTRATRVLDDVLREHGNA